MRPPKNIFKMIQIYLLYITVKEKCNVKCKCFGTVTEYTKQIADAYQKCDERKHDLNKEVQNVSKELGNDYDRNFYKIPINK